MIVTKKLHDDIGETGDIANIASFASANFSMFIAGGCYPPPPKRYTLVNHPLTIALTITYPQAGLPLTF